MDFVIVGGGVTGLWTLNLLQQSGFKGCLLESAALGSGQSMQAQGMIHGGLKYGLANDSTGPWPLSHMPKLWTSCFQGTGLINLQTVRVLSPHQYLWTQPAWWGHCVGQLASWSLTAVSKRLHPSEFPPLFAHDFKGHLYQIEEPVVAMDSLLRTLQQPVQHALIQVDAPVAVKHDTVAFTLQGRTETLQPRFIILAAGEGNQDLAKGVGILMQRRPLRMVWMRSEALMPFWGHALQASDRPRLSISAHPDANPSQWLWYLGGALSEDGWARSEQAQVQAAKSLLQTLLPHWATAAVLQNADMGTILANRAEPLQPQGERPKQPFVYYTPLHSTCTLVTTWPIKMAWAPAVALQIRDHMRAILKPHSEPASPAAAASHPKPSIAPYPWETTTPC